MDKDYFLEVLFLVGRWARARRAAAIRHQVEVERIRIWLRHRRWAPDTCDDLIKLMHFERSLLDGNP